MIASCIQGGYGQISIEEHLSEGRWFIMSGEESVVRRAISQTAERGYYEGQWWVPRMTLGTLAERTAAFERYLEKLADHTLAWKDVAVNSKA